MWIKAGCRYYNTNSIAYVQVAMEDGQREPKTVYVHFVNEQHVFTLHGADAKEVFQALNVCMNTSAQSIVADMSGHLASVR